MLAMSQIPPNKTKKIIPQRRIIEAGHREKDRADLKGGYEKRLCKNRGPYRQRWRSWIRFVGQNILQTAPDNSVGVSKLY